MKCKYGKYNGYEENVFGVVDLDNLDITDLNFSTATPDTIYFYNLANKLSERGKAKMRGIYGLGFCNDPVSFIYILPDTPLTSEQKSYCNEKRFIDAFNRDVAKYIDDDDRVITKELLEANGWEWREDKFWEHYYIKVIPNVCSLTIRCDVSNMPNRDWTLHIDNAEFETIANMDIHTVNHFNAAMKLMDIDYEL